MVGGARQLLWRYSPQCAASRRALAVSWLATWLVVTQKNPKHTTRLGSSQGTGRLGCRGTGKPPGLAYARILNNVKSCRIDLSQILGARRQDCRRMTRCGHANSIATWIRIVAAGCTVIIGSSSGCSCRRAIVCASMHSPVNASNAARCQRASYSGVRFVDR
jgi:hypothetical protein